ncbi:hypothetical protein [Nonlabens marinus]|uniref:Haemagluttinin motif family protein n=1 Tax=Nonlabens marinus S1-08 TaxID=1454201 RepID=W8W0L9_9FLAO|nr:hypothetical protein [Nonlabens marinus]BAO56556.1 haemagluttinin motif family protein [Nonlabens marinus S1-08]
MKSKTTLLYLFSLLSLTALGQVGIRTIQPTADLEIVSNPTPGADNYNGVIIPKVSALPVTGDATFPKAAQAGLILYLDTTDTTKGIYMFDGTQYVKLEAGALAGAFFNTGTTTIATTTTANVQRTGNLSLGSSLNSGRLNLEILNSELVSNAPEIGLRIANANKTTAAGTSTYGILTENTSSSGVKFGIRNVVTSAGNGNKTGIDSEVTPSSTNNAVTIGTQSNINNVPSGASGAIVYGFSNFMGSLNGGSTSIGYNTKSGFGDIVSQTNYGLYSEVGRSTSRGTKYGVYSKALNTGTENAYSGYFVGNKFAIRNQNESTGYDLTVDTGTAGQVLTSNGDQTTSWKNANANGFKTNIRTISGGTALSTDHTLIINGDISIPDAVTSNAGQIYIIALGINSNNRVITAIGGDFRYPGDANAFSTYGLNNNGNGTRGITIQSNGTDWYIIDVLRN